MLCSHPIDDYMVVPVDQVNVLLSQGYQLFGPPLCRFNQKEDICQALIKVGVGSMNVAVESPSSPIKLKAMEARCLQRFIEDKNMKEIAAELNRSPNSVEHIFLSLRKKFNCKHNIGMVIAAQNAGFIIDGKVVL